MERRTGRRVRARYAFARLAVQYGPPPRVNQGVVMSLSDVIRNIAKTITNKEKAKELPLVVIQSTLSAAGQALLLVDRVKNSIKGLASREEVEETKRPAAEQLAESAEDKPARREPVIFAPRPSATGAAEPNGTAPKAKADPVIFTPATNPPTSPAAEAVSAPEVTTASETKATVAAEAEAVSAPEAVEVKPVVVEEPAAEKPAATEAVTTEAVTKEPVGEEPVAKEAVTEAVVVESAEPVAKRATTRRAPAKPKTVTPEAATTAAASDAAIGAEAEAPVKKPARKAPARTTAVKPAASKPAASKAAAAKPAAKKAVAEPGAGEAVEAAGAVPGEPLVGYGELTVASLRARMRGKSAAQIGELLAYERATQGRPEVVKMYENRLAKLEAGE
ncbi:hypothetical protein AB0K48_19880 [Nonomuraea sp. NPDC055795]